MCCNDENLSVDKDDNDDCNELDTIYEQIYEMDFFDYDIDDYWAKGWSINDEGFYRDDADAFDGREVRIFPTRYRLSDFVFTKSLRRVFKKNRDLKIIIRPFRSSEGKDDLYTAHLHRRFQLEKPHYSLRKKYDYLNSSNIMIMEICVFDERKMVAGSIFFVGERSVVGSIGFWDTDDTWRSLGMLTVLLEIQYALRNKKEFYYLGSYIRQDPNYQYKTRFSGLELFDWDNNTWVDFKAERIKEMFNHRFRCLDDFKEKDPECTIYLFEVCAEANSRIIAAALINLRARTDSEFSVLLITTEIENTQEQAKFPQRLHRWCKSEFEERGDVKIVRAFYKNGDVYEFNYVSPDWAKSDPINPETRRVIKDGIRILYDSQGILENLEKTICPTKYLITRRIGQRE